MKLFNEEINNIFTAKDENKGDEAFKNKLQIISEAAIFTSKEQELAIRYNEQ